MYQDPEEINLVRRTIVKDVSTDSSDTEKPPSRSQAVNNVESYDDEPQEKKPRERKIESSPTNQQTSCTATSDPQHRLLTENDLAEALQKAETLTANQSSRKAIVSFYDFAGQYVFHASHPTFLSPSAIYILTFDLHRILQRKTSSSIRAFLREKLSGDYRGNVELSDLESIIFWLNIIYMFAASKPDLNPHVILVGTHADKIPKKHRDAIAENFFKEFRNAIVGSPVNAILSKEEFIIDNSERHSEVYSQLKTEIFELAKLQSSWGEKTPTKWLLLDREVQLLKESGRKVLTLEELNTINRGLQVKIDDDTEMNAFLQFLHQAGEAVYYSDKRLRDNVVLDPVWLIDGLKTVITAENFAIRTPVLDKQWKAFSESGVICRSAIVSIFEKKKEDPSLFKNHDHMIRLMEKFLFIAAPIGFHDDLDANGDETEVDILDSLVSRIESFQDKEQHYHTVCQPVQEFLVQSLGSILQAMGLPVEFRQCIQCPLYKPTDSGGYLDINHMTNQMAVTCDKCPKSHVLNVQELLGSWIDMKQGETEPKRAAVVDGCVGQEKVPVPDMEELVPEAPMTKQHINHARLCNVLVTVCAEGLRDILLSQVPPGFANFYSSLLANKPALTSMKQIRQEQVNLLFPDPQGRFTGTLDQFDITLLYALIRNISSVPAPVTGWGRPPTDKPRDKSLGACVERIRNCRNHVNGHSADGRLEDQIFEDYWDEISAIMDDIENSIGPKGYRMALEERKNQVLTSKEAQILQLKLKELEEKNKNLMEDLGDILKKLQAVVEKYAY